MKLSIFTLFPELYTPFISTSLIKRACERNDLAITVTSLFEFCAPKERVDAPTFGHGAGMLIRPEVIDRAVLRDKERGLDGYKVFFSPHGRPLTQELLRELSIKIRERGNTVQLFPARYEGMDARVEEYYADSIISVGEFVAMGGDVPAMLFLEGLLRLIPGVVGEASSVEHESFTGPFVDYPEYTQPVVWHDKEVPEVLRSGNHKAIETWQKEQAVQRSIKDHFGWVRTHVKTDLERTLVRNAIPAHYIALMHDGILLPDGTEGTTSVTSLDIHDIARSACTYGIKNYCMVTPLADQQRIVRRLLDFWRSSEGGEYNTSRQQALTGVRLVDSLEQVLDLIVHQERQEPLLIGTSARQTEYDTYSKKKGHKLSFADQGYIWSYKRPVLLLLGTGNGLGKTVLDRCDYLLPPVTGFTSYNHLSVRSAAAVLLDRWLGCSS